MFLLPYYMKKSISSFVPEDTTYFYGYPSGEDSSFYNLVPPAIEELVSARPLICAGQTTNVVTFCNSTTQEMLKLLRDLGVILIDDSRIVRLSEGISADVVGGQRNTRVVAELLEKVPEKSLIMAQPYLRSELNDVYQTDPLVGVTLNDKRSMYEYIPKQYLPELLGLYSSGAEFAAERRNLAPCVVKISSSSSGDGVRVCISSEEVALAQSQFKAVEGNILVQRYIVASENIGVQFGIPSSADEPIEVLGLSRQITSKSGEFIGGVIIKNDAVPLSLQKMLLQEVLPKVREMGWYGVGALDVLMTESGEIYCIDPNYRITAMTAYVYQMLEGVVGRSMLSMTARFPGNKNDFIRLARVNEGSQLLNVVAVREDDEGLQFNGALLFDDRESLMENAQRALQEGVQATVLTSLLEKDSSIIFPNIR